MSDHPGVQSKQLGRVRRALDVRRLGTLGYPEGLDLQQRLVADRRAGTALDTLLLLQHPHVITLGVGTRGSLEHVRAPPEALAELGVALFETRRGGDVTYHGPGQLVGYPILDLKPDRCDVRRYVRDLEEVIIRTVKVFGVRGERIDGLTGVWVGDAKLASIGVRISRWVTSHGFALNVSTDLKRFGLIMPCGIRDCAVTSLQVLLGRPIEVSEVEEVLIDRFRSVLG